MQSLQQTPAIHLLSLHSDLITLILLQLPLKHSWLTRNVCRYFYKFDRTAECQHRLNNMSFTDFNFLRTRSKGDWPAFMKKHKDSKLLPLIDKVFLSGNYILWVPPTQVTCQAVSQFGHFLVRYGLVLLTAPHFSRDASAVIESAKKCASDWIKKFKLPFENLSPPCTAQTIFRAAWQKTQDPLHGTLLGIAQINGQGLTILNGAKQLVEMTTHCAQAKLFLGFIYRDGKVVEKNPDIAVAWLRSAADQKDPDPLAQYSLAEQYEKGEGVEQNLVAAFDLYLRAANQNYLPAYSNLADMYFHAKGVAKNVPEGLRLLRHAAEKNDALAQYNLGVQYLNGFGVEQNYKEAAHWIFLSATQDYRPAQHRLASLYEKGQGVEKNFEEAFRWCKRAAKEDPQAQHDLGGLYYTGWGVKKNDKAAAKWFRIAAENSIVHSQTNIAYMCANGIGVERNIQEAIKWYRLAATQGSCMAKLCLGILLPGGPEADQFFEQGKKELNKEVLDVLAAETTDLAKQIVARLKG